MIVRQYIKCATCGYAHIARIQIGSSKRQEHMFPCYGCKEPIKVALDLDHENTKFEFHLVENAVKNDCEEGKPIYMSPDFVADSDKIDQELYFGSFDFMKAVGFKRLEKIMKLPGESIEPSFRVIDEWQSIKKIWRLDDSKQYQIASKLNGEFARKHGITEGTLRENTWAFVNAMFEASDALRQEIRGIGKSNQAEFLRFISFYQTHLRVAHRRSYFDVSSDYFDNFTEHSQVFAYVRTDTELPNKAKTTSVDFNSVKSFYAKAYEFFAGAICILTCLNNIKAGRKFDQLEKITLSKYLETDKAKRRDSIMDNKVFADATLEFDSKVRNASYHNWFFMRDDHQTIEYRSGGTGALETMTYTEYLMRCGKMMRQIFNIFSIELEFDEFACEMAAIRLR
jgi:hypothetical protein